MNFRLRENIIFSKSKNPVLPTITIALQFQHYFLIRILWKSMGFPGGSEVKASACNAGNLGSIPGLDRSPGEGNGNPLQYSCLENPMDGEAWRATVHEVTESDMTEQLSIVHAKMLNNNIYNILG